MIREEISMWYKGTEVYNGGILLLLSCLPTISIDIACNVTNLQ